MKIKEKIKIITKEKISIILPLLIVLNTVSMLIANIIACKTFNLFKFPGMDWYVVLPCAVIVFPITYILSYVISEVYGYKWSRRASWISFTMNLFMVLIFEIAIIIVVTLLIIGSIIWAVKRSKKGLGCCRDCQGNCNKCNRK